MNKTLLILAFTINFLGCKKNVDLDFFDTYTTRHQVGKIYFQKKNKSLVELTDLQLSTSPDKDVLKKIKISKKISAKSLNKILGADANVDSEIKTQVDFKFDNVLSYTMPLDKIGIAFQKKEKDIVNALKPFKSLLSSAGKTIVITKSFSSNQFTYKIEKNNKSSAKVKKQFKEIADTNNNISYVGKKENLMEFKGKEQLFFAYDYVPINIAFGLDGDFSISLEE